MRLPSEFMTAQSLSMNTTDKGKQFISAALTVDGVTLSNYDLEIARVIVTLNHRRETTLNYGGYSYDTGTTGYESLVFDMEYVDGKWRVPESAKAYLAGTYTYSLRILIDQINDDADGVDDFPVQSFTITKSDETVLTVWSKLPTVNISKAAYASTSSKTEVSISGNNVTSVTVYHYTSGTEICGIGLTTNYDHPYVYLNLSGYGGANSAELVFAREGGGTVHLYTSGNNTNDTSTKTTSYVWTANGAVQRFVGACVQKDNSSDSMENAGKLTGSTLVMTVKNGANQATFKVDIPDITITN